MPGKKRRSNAGARFRALLACLLAVLCSCAPIQPLPQPHRVVDPSSMSNAVRTPRWDIAAVGYLYSGEGLDYAAAGLSPVCLGLSNKTDERPQILVEEVRGLAPDGEYLPYSIPEAVRLVVSSNAFAATAADAARSGGIGAAVGAGLGVLIGLLAGGNDLIWKGALVGGAIGGASGALSAGSHSQAALRDAAEEELYRYAWRTAPLPPKFSQAGYIYFPGNVGVGRIKVVVRSGKDVATYVIPLSAPPRPDRH